MELKRTLAIDYGEKRLGIAISDPLNITAQGMSNISNSPRMYEEIKEIAERECVGHIIIGLPRRLDGSIGQAAQNVKNFGETLQKYVNIPISYWEEWLSTKEAEKHLISLDKSRKKRKGLIDRIAAQLILQGYLDSKR